MENSEQIKTTLDEQRREEQRALKDAASKAVYFHTDAFNTIYHATYR